MDLQELLKFTNIDDKFYSALIEYRENKNDVIILEKIYENLFNNYNAIKILSKDYTNKKSLDFFMGSKPVEVYLKLKDRTEINDDKYKLSDFINDLFFESKYSDSKKHSILVEVINLSKNSRQVYTSTSNNIDNSKFIIEKLLFQLDKKIKDKSFEINPTNIKWLELIKNSLDSDSKKIIINSIATLLLELKSDINKNKTKLINLRNFLSLNFLSSVTMTEGKNYLISSLMIFIEDIKDYDDSFGNPKREFTKNKLMSILTVLYEKNVPDYIYKLIFEEEVKDGIKSTEEHNFITSNLHLISDRDVTKDYMRLALNESIEFLEYYNMVNPFLEKINGMKQYEKGEKLIEVKQFKKDHITEGKWNIGDFYLGKPLAFKCKYNVKFMNMTIAEYMFSNFPSEMSKHFNDLLHTEINYLNSYYLSYQGNFALSFMLFMNDTSNDSNKEYFDNIIKNILEKEDFNKFTDNEITDLYKIYFRDRLLLVMEKIDRFDSKAIELNVKHCEVAKKFKIHNKKSFDIILSNNLRTSMFENNNISKNLAKSVFLYFYELDEVVKFFNICNEYFIEESNFKYYLDILSKTDLTDIELCNLIRSSFTFLDKVLIELLNRYSTNKDIVYDILNISFRKYPNLIEVIKNYPYEDMELKQKVFNSILEHIETNQSKELLTHNKSLMTNDKRKDALNILEDAIGNLFSLK